MALARGRGDLEHKAVAYDVWVHATRGWSGWKVKSRTMLLVTSNFVRHRFEDALDLLRQDGITGWKAKARLVWYFVGKPGILRRAAPAWLAYFIPGLHPWTIDDRALISRYDSKFPDAVPAPG